eukprot:scaffold447755_cov20-Prasinocladus_malaysianus.AAC.1
MTDARRAKWAYVLVVGPRCRHRIASQVEIGRQAVWMRLAGMLDNLWASFPRPCGRLGACGA